LRLWGKCRALRHTHLAGHFRAGSRVEVLKNAQFFCDFLTKTGAKMVRQSAHVEMRGISLTSKSGIVEKLGTSFSTTRRVISRREAATFLHDYS
jgi:hypothetical protein